MKTARENLSMNLRYYRKIFNLSQEKFGEMIGSNLKYINELENCKRNFRIDMLDKISSGLNIALKNEKSVRDKLGYNEITSDMLIKYQEGNKTFYKRIDER